MTGVDVLVENLKGSSVDAREAAAAALANLSADHEAANGVRLAGDLVSLPEIFCDGIPDEMSYNHIRNYPGAARKVEWPDIGACVLPMIDGCRRHRHARAPHR